jgi:hypothetical protein
VTGAVDVLVTDLVPDSSGIGRTGTPESELFAFSRGNQHDVGVFLLCGPQGQV